VPGLFITGCPEPALNTNRQSPPRHRTRPNQERQNEKTFPTLYKKTITGADQFWSIETEDNTILTCWGQVGGKEQTATETIAAGKNIGRANETTPEEQAQIEAQGQQEEEPWLRREPVR
jgi:predicted DNA-binding WGR domain protein